MSAQVPIRQVSAHLLERITRAPLGVAEPITATITMDEEWSPRIQADLVVPQSFMTDYYAPGGSVTRGKLQGNTITLELVVEFGPGLSCADLTDVHGGSMAALTAAYGGSVEAVTRAHTRPWHPGERIQPLSAATALWGGSSAAVTAEHGGNVAAITRALRVPGGSYLIPPTERHRFVLSIRKITPDDIEGTVTLQLVSEDIRLHDYRQTLAVPLTSTYTSLRGLVADVLARGTADAPPEYSLPLAPGDDIPIVAGQLWKTGQTAWEFLHPILESVGWALWADSHGWMHLTPRATFPAPVPADSELNLIDYEPTTDYADAYYQGAIVEYTDAPDTDPAARFDIYAPPSARRIMHVTRAGVNWGAGAAQEIVERSIQRARTGTATLTLTPALLPGHRVPFPHAFTAGTIRSIRHSLPDGITALTLRDIRTD